MVAVRRANQLDRDPQPAAVLSHAPVQNGRNVERLAELTDILSLPLN